MPDGELRRPPPVWEQRLARTTSILGVGISSSGDATAIVPPQPPPGAGGGTEPAPVAPPAGVFKKPSTPQLVGGLQGITVLWDGLNSDGDLYPYDTSYIEVHTSTAGTAFTVGTATLKGRLDRPGGLFVGGLSAGTTYYFRLRGADPLGNVTDPSDAASGLTGLTTSGDYGTATIGSGAVSFNARQIGGVASTVGSNAPSSPLEGDIWLDSSPLSASISGITASGSALTVSTSTEHRLGQTDSISISGVTNTTTRTLNNAVGNGSQVTYTTTVAHGFSAGQSVTVSGVNPSTYNRSGTISSVTSTTFAIAANATGAYVSGGQAVATTNSFNIAGTVESVPSDTSFTITSSLTGTYVSGGTVTGPVKGLRYRRYDGSNWVLQPWGPEALSAKSITALQLTTGAITAGAIAAGAVTTDKLTAGTITGFQINGGTISGGFISGGTVSAGFITGGTVNAAVYTGGSISSSTFTGGTIAGNIAATGTVSGAVLSGGTITGGFITGGTISSPFLTTGSSSERRVILGDVGETTVLKFNAASSSDKFLLGMNADNVNLGLSTTGTGSFQIVPTLDAQNACAIATSTSGRGLRVASNGEVFSFGIDDNTTASAANVRVGVSAQLLKSTSTVRLKDELAPLDDGLAGVPVEKLSADPPSVDPYDVLTLTPTEFRSLSPADGDARALGFIAEDVAVKFPWAANWDEDGLPSAIEDRPIIAALVAVIKDLRARIEALEA